MKTKRKTALKKKFYSVVSSKQFFKGRNYTAPKPLVVIRYNAKNDTINPVKQVKTIIEGKRLIKAKKGRYYTQTLRNK